MNAAAVLAKKACESRRQPFEGGQISVQCGNSVMPAGVSARQHP
jgi:hypothetical protein